jgi:hypothetical protein
MLRRIAHVENNSCENIRATAETKRAVQLQVGVEAAGAAIRDERLRLDD